MGQLLVGKDLPLSLGRRLSSFGLGLDHAWRHKLRLSLHKSSKPFVNHTVLAMIGMVSVALILPSYFVGKKINRGSPFKKLP